MNDPGHIATDKLIEKYERRIKKEYAQAQRELNQQLKAHTAKYKAKDKIKRAEKKAGKITEAEYQSWVKGQMFTGKLWEQKRDLMARELQLVSEKARSMRYGFQIEAYAENHSYATYLVEHGLKIDTAYTLYNKQAVERLMKNEKILPDPTGLLKQKIDRGEAIKWRNGKIQSIATQAILQGDSIEDTARRIAETLSVQDASAALRYARTSMTGAQNAGRIDGFQRAVALGVKMGQQWLATPDGLTRDSHREIDGEIVEVGGTFSNGCKYPGDPGGPPEEVWNCRCDVVAALDGMDNDVSDLEKRWNRLDGDPDYFEWKTAHLPDEKKAEVKAAYWAGLMKGVGDKTYSGIWRQAVKTSEYEAYKDRIQGKRDYYSAEMAKLDKNDPKYKEFRGYLNDLDEFERNGKLYATYANEWRLAEDELKAARLANIDPSDMFSQVRKDNALWFDRQAGGFRAADAYFDPPAQAIHRAATRQEQEGFFTYTAGSGGHNRPLAGYEKPWSLGGSGWEERFYKGPGSVWIDFEGKGDQIRGLTTLIEKSTYPNDIWLQSGQDFQTLEGTLRLPRNTLHKMTEEELKRTLVGKEFELGQFISTAVNEGGGSCFNSKPTKWNIYAPQGSEMLYASDKGAFKKGENELILQRGAKYKITDVYWGNDATDGNTRKLFVDMELHPEKGYNKFQQDPGEWKGSKKNYHD